MQSQAVPAAARQQEFTGIQPACALDIYFSVGQAGGIASLQCVVAAYTHAKIVGF